MGGSEISVEGLDDIDRGILRLLQGDGRMPYRQIARELGVSEGTVRIRTGRMQESGVLNIVAIADPFRLGYRVLAFLLVGSNPATTIMWSPSSPPGRKQPTCPRASGTRTCTYSWSAATTIT